MNIPSPVKHQILNNHFRGLKSIRLKFLAHDPTPRRSQPAPTKAPCNCFSHTLVSTPATKVPESAPTATATSKPSKPVSAPKPRVGGRVGDRGRPKAIYPGRIFQVRRAARRK